MIRPAIHSDVPRLVELAILLHATSNYSTMAFDAEKTGNFMRELIDGLGVVFVAEVGGEVVGGVAAGITDQWFSNDLIVFDYSIFIDPSRRSGITAMRLVNTLKEWGRIKGAKQLHMGIGTGIHVEGTVKLYQACGLNHFGPLMMMEL
ncbi:GNAT family N-acetyltransferase [Pseudomonas sp. IT-P4]|uniref:GNAT family N-acetyltransferase n=1 Tax=Pseudomonas sp. IT-P4 TaxID=3026446 RepID=UPI0039E1CC13|nr:GNAT family N-acetyltransferase [Pseudomonas fluorescens]